MSDVFVKMADNFRLGFNPSDHDVDHANWLIDRLSAHLITARNFKIKKLEWVTPSPTTGGQWQDTTGVYEIEDSILFIGHAETGDPHASGDEAKAAAQDHYERLVMAALDFAGDT